MTVVAPQTISAVIKNTVPAKTSKGKKDCTFCKPEGFKFLPLRYSVVCGIASDQVAQWPELTHPLGDRVSDKKLGTSRYTVRMLREGYLYVLVDRSKGAEWQAYAVTTAGMLASFPVGAPPAVVPPFTCDLATDGVGASFVAIEKIEGVKSIFLLFSPDALPMTILDRRATDKAGMQQIPAKNWKGHPHLLDASDLDKWVAEFKLNTDGMGSVSTNDPKLKGRLLFAQQLYPLMGGPTVGDKAKYDDHLKRLTALKQKLGRLNSPAVVLWDPIGITQELNLWHRHIADEIDGYLNQPIVAREVAISQCIVGLRYAVEQQAVDRAVYASPEFATGPWGEEVLDDREAAEQVKAQGWSRYQMCYDEFKRGTSELTVKSWVNGKLPIAEHRFADLDGWLSSTALVWALDNYDVYSVDCGARFHAQVSQCTYALATSQAGTDRLRAWRADEQLKQSNLMARQLLFNQKAAIDEFKAALKKASGQKELDTATIQSWLSATTGVFDKANDLAAAAFAGGAVPGGGLAGKFLTAPMFMSAVGTTLFNAGGAADRLYAFVLYARGITKAMMQAGADTLIGVFNAIYPSKAGVAIAETKNLRARLSGLIKDKGSDFAALHLSAAIALIETWNLIIKNRGYDPKKHTSRDLADVISAYCATTAATGLAIANVSKIAKGESSLWFQHLKLSSGVLGAVTAGISAWENFADMKAAFKVNHYSLAILCSVKFALNGAVAVGSLIIGGLYSASLLAGIGKLSGDTRLGLALRSISTAVAEAAERKIAIGLAEKVAVRVVGEAIIAGVGWVLLAETVIELGIGAVVDNKLQIWLTRCTFHKPPGSYKGLLSLLHDANAGVPYSTLDEETKAFDEALKGGI